MGTYFILFQHDFWSRNLGICWDFVQKTQYIKTVLVTIVIATDTLLAITRSYRQIGLGTFELRIDNAVHDDHSQLK